MPSQKVKVCLLSKQARPTISRLCSRYISPTVSELLNLGLGLGLGFVDSRPPTTDTGQSSNLHLARLVLIPARDRSPKQRHFVNPSIRLLVRMRKSEYP
jgi:hypothetical protein